VAKSLIARIVPDLNRGTAYGLYNASLGVMTLPANLIAGFLWDKVSPASLFYFGAACALAALVLLSLAGIEKNQELKAG
jgi:MFS family permease